MEQGVSEGAIGRGGRSFVGRVVSNATNKTVTVEVSRIVQHPRYHKYLARTKKFTAHDESNQCAEGDTVLITECRPLSKTKRWIVVEKRG